MNSSTCKSVCSKNGPRKWYTCNNWKKNEKGLQACLTSQCWNVHKFCKTSLFTVLMHKFCSFWCKYLLLRLTKEIFDVYTAVMTSLHTFTYDMLHCTFLMSSEVSQYTYFLILLLLYRLVLFFVIYMMLCLSFKLF